MFNQEMGVIGTMEDLYLVGVFQVDPAYLVVYAIQFADFRGHVFELGQTVEIEIDLFESGEGFQVGGGQKVGFQVERF
jgi:hypothetical protein